MPEVMSLLVVLIAMACGAARALEVGGQNLYALPADADLKKAGSDDKGDPLPPPAFPPRFVASLRVRDLRDGGSGDRGAGSVYWLHEEILDDSVTLRLNRTLDSTGEYDDDGDEGRAAVEDGMMAVEQVQDICAYSRHQGLGHKISGIDCVPTVNLPTNCFCRGQQGGRRRSASSSVGAMVPLSDLLRAVEKAGTDFQETEESGGRVFRKWSVDKSGLKVEAVFLVEGQGDVVPFSFRVEHNVSRDAFSEDELNAGGGDSDDGEGSEEKSSRSSRQSAGAGGPGRPVSDCRSVWLEYTVTAFRFLSSDDENRLRREAGWSPAPRGVFCPRVNVYQRRLPEIPNQFSVRIESVDEYDSSVSYSEQYYDLPHSIVSFAFSPRSHSPPSILFARFAASLFPRGGRSAHAAFRIIHDFNNEMQYTINQRSGNCSVERIPLTSPDSELVEASHVRLKHAKELLDVDPTQFMYSGERWIRSILCDVWVAEKSSILGYQTTEVFFSRHDWNILVEEVNAHQELPVGMATYTAANKNSSSFDTVVTSHYFEFNPSQPSWRNFDIATCVRQQKRLFLKFTVNVSYSQLVQFSLETAHNSLRKAIADLCNVSPLRVVDIHLSSAISSGPNSEREGIDVWFVILEVAKPTRAPSSAASVISSHNLIVDDGSANMLHGGHGDYWRKSKEVSMGDAYRTLVKAISQNDVPLRLEITAERDLVVHISRNSLQMASEATHPVSRSGSGTYRFLRATYTAGSMAGLGFSMAILGICVGIFLGFLLWKRRIGLPYHLQHSPMNS